MQKSSCKDNRTNRNKEIFEWTDAIITALIFFVFIFTMFFRFAVVNGSSMLPTLVNNDWIIIYNFLYTPLKGDIVVINDPGSLNEPIIKRVVATENDKVRIDNASGKLYVNDVVQDDEYCYTRNSTYEGDYEFPEFIPNGYIVAMGDNRENSLDSRYEIIGLIKKEKVLGKASAIISPLRRVRIF